jgi:hypothetical protein
MALNPMSALMPKHHSVGHKTARLTFGRSKNIKANALFLSVRPRKAGAPFINIDWGDIPLTQQYLLY